MTYNVRHSPCVFFSSRRRHTRWPRDWSSDVCSSDLMSSPQRRENVKDLETTHSDNSMGLNGNCDPQSHNVFNQDQVRLIRSEERRVGKEWSYGVSRADGICRPEGRMKRLEVCDHTTA